MCNHTKSRRAMMKGIKADINKHGFQTVGVSGKHLKDCFAYTVGLEISFGHPELLMTGIQGEAAHLYFHLLVKKIRAGMPINQEDVLDGACRFPMQVREVDPFRAGETHMLLTDDYYSGPDHYRVLQLVYPDPKGLFPWQGGYDFPAQELLFDLDK